MKSLLRQIWLKLIQRKDTSLQRPRPDLHVESLEGRRLLAAVLPHDKSRISDALTQYVSTSALMGTSTAVSAASQSNESSAMLVNAQGDVGIRVTAPDVDQALPQLASLGFKVSGSEPDLHFVEGYLPKSSIAALESLGDLIFGALPIYRPHVNTGSVTSQADVVLESNRVRGTTPTGFDGTGVKIGVLSDSYNNLNGAAAGVTSGDLPADVQVLSDLASGGTDEGRGMLELVHDLAPGSPLAFATAFNGEADFAQQIRDLADPAKGNAQIIVDDVGYFAAPFFQDGVVAQAVNEVTANRGVTYFSSAGNQASQSYESSNISFTNDSSGTFLGSLYDFDLGVGVDTRQSITIPNGSKFTPSFQWDQPFFTTSGVTTDIDIFLVNAGTNTIVASSDDDNIANKTPGEFFQFTNNTAGTAFELIILKFAGPTPGRMKYIDSEGATINEFATNSSTIIGHAAAAGTASVGAVFYGTQTVAEGFTSAGPSTILFTAAGVAQTAEVRQTPRISAIDGTDTSFFGSGDSDSNTFPNFFGTSAAAPHAAAVAALVKQANPTFTSAQIRARLESTATDLGTPGYDNLTGLGIINAYDAVFGSPAPTTLNFSEGFETNTVLTSAWETHSTGSGRILVNTANSPNDGIRHLTMDTFDSFAFGLNEAILHVNATNQSNVQLTFDQKEFSDNDNAMSATFSGSENSDGVAFSVDGTNWKRVISLTGTNSTNANQTRTFNLSTLAAAAGVTLGSDVRIKFQQFGLFPISNDGFAFDRIQVSGTPSTTISIGDVSVTEGDTGTTNAVFTVTLATPSAQTVTVDLATSDLSASQSVDYTITADTLTFAPGETTKTIAVPVLGDTFDEDDEFFFVLLSNPTNYTIVDGLGEGTIIDDDTSTISIDDVIVNEGDSGTTPALFTVSLSTPSSKVVTVQYETNAVTATAGVDYNTGNPVTRKFFGDITGTTVADLTNDPRFPASPDSTAELVSFESPTDAADDYGQILESLFVPPVSGAYRFSLASDDSSQLFLSTDATEGNLVQIAQLNGAFGVHAWPEPPDERTSAAISMVAGQHYFIRALMKEGNGGDHLSVGMRREGDAAFTLVDSSVLAQISPNALRTITFAPGETSKTITVNVVGETLPEPDETFSVDLSNSTNAAIVQSSGVATINANDDPTVSLTVDDATIGEVVGQTLVTINLSAAPIVDVIVELDFSGTATFGSDYTTGLPSNIVTIPAGNGSFSFFVTSTDDVLDEVDESVDVQIINVTNGAISGGFQSVTTTIVDDDAPPTVTLAVDNASIQEATGVAIFKATLSAVSGQAVTVALGYTGSATLTNDYTRSNTEIVIPAGSTTGTVTVTAMQDTLLDANETVIVDITNVTNGTESGTQQATTTIIDDESSLAIAANSAIKAEGNSGITPFTFTVTRSGSLAGVSTVQYNVTGTAPIPINLTDIGGAAQSGTVTFNAGESSKEITINVSGDTTVETDENLLVRLSLPSASTTIATATATGIVQNDDTSYAIAATSAVKAEGNSGTTPFTFTVTRNGLTTGTSSVNFAVTSSVATAADFSGNVIPTGTLNFAANETSKLVTINVLGESVFETNEGFIVTLSAPSVPGTITAATATGTIQNDDAGLVIAATSAVKAEGNSGNTPFTFTITRSGNLAITSTVTYKATGTAPIPINLIDIGGAAQSGTVTFNANEISKVVTINVSGDTSVETDENMLVTLSIPTVGTSITTATATSIVQNDDTGYSIAATSATNLEGNSGATPFTFTVTRSGLTSGSSSVKYAVTGSTTNGATAADFSGNVFPTGTVSFAAGETSKLFTISVLGETLFEVNEGFIVTLNTPSLGTILTAAANGTIQNDDTALAIAAKSAVKAEGSSGNTPFTFTITRSGNLGIVSTVHYNVTGTAPIAINLIDIGGAVQPGDVTFNNGESSKDITINVSGDLTIEPDEYMLVTLSSPSAGTSITTTTATGIVQNDDWSYAIAATLSTNSEGHSGATPFTFTVSRAGGAGGSSTVNYAVTGSTTNGASITDFSGNVFPSGTVTFAAGETSKLLTINVLGESVLESDEGFIVTLSAPSPSGTITTATANGMIQNDDASIAIAATSANNFEGDGGTTPFTFTVSRTGNLNIISTATYTVTAAGPNLINITDVGGSVPTGTVTFAAGESSKVVTINVTGDTTVELDENFKITLSAASAGTTIITNIANGVILNDDTGYAIAATSAVKAEGNVGTTQFTFTVTRSGVTTGSSSVNFAVTGSTTNGATADDFSGGVFPAGTVSFLAGETSKLITIDVLADTVAELSQGFIVTLSAPSLGTLITASATGTIQNDD